VKKALKKVVETDVDVCSDMTFYPQLNPMHRREEGVEEGSRDSSFHEVGLRYDCLSGISV
jgi:hypothetical protein